jgi:hypothetical protein
MHAARHRALRELGAFARQMADHWTALGERLDGTAGLALADGAGAASEILAAVRVLASARELEIGRAALGAGRVARARPPVPDAVLERNQALRFALLDGEHLLTLIEYVGALSANAHDQEMEAACAGWAATLREPVAAARAAAIALGSDPDVAIEPLSPGHKLTFLLGWLGEAADRRVR